MFLNVPAGSADMRTFPNLKNFAAFITKTRTSTTWGLIPGAADSSDSCWNFQGIEKVTQYQTPHGSASSNILCMYSSNAEMEGCNSDNQLTQVASKFTDI